VEAIFSTDQVLSATERNSLVLLMECAGQGDCQMTGDEVDYLSAALAERYPGQVDQLELKSIYWNSKGQGAQGLSQLVEEALITSRLPRDKYPVLVAYKIEQREFGDMYRLLIEWLKLDRRRNDLHLQKIIFDFD
jgi:hypothetical protein